MLAPSPCERLSRLRVVWASLTSQRPSARLLLGWQGVPVFRLGLGFGILQFPGFPCRGSLSAYPAVPPGTDGTSQVLDASLSPCQALGTSAGPRESHRAETLDRSLCSLLSAWFPGGATLSRSSFRLADSSVLASVALTTSPPAFLLLTRLNRFGVVHHPTGLGNALSTLHDFCSPVPQVTPRKYRSASRARLDTGGWLALARQGLSPRKKRQASLDAPTPELRGAGGLNQGERGKA